MRATSIRLPEPLAQALEEECRLQGYDSLSPLIRDALTAYVAFTLAWRVAAKGQAPISLDEFVRATAEAAQRIARGEEGEASEHQG